VSATLLLLGFEFQISLFFATRESIDCYIALFGKNYPNSLNPIGGDLFGILLRIRVSIGVSMRLTSFAHQPMNAGHSFVTHTTCHPNKEHRRDDRAEKAAKLYIFCDRDPDQSLKVPAAIHSRGGR
jgi:hypothetical protein